MSLPSWLRRSLRLPSRIALLLGAGALSAAAEHGIAEAHLGDSLVRVPQQSAKTFGEVRIWSAGGRIYISEDGRNAQELPLADTPEARRLRQLLDGDGADAASPRVLHNRIILVGGGGDGFHWAPTRKSDTADKAQPPKTPISGPKDTASRRGNSPAPAAVSRNTEAAEAANRK